MKLIYGDKMEQEEIQSLIQEAANRGWNVGMSHLGKMEFCLDLYDENENIVAELNQEFSILLTFDQAVEMLKYDYKAHAELIKEGLRLEKEALEKQTTEIDGKENTNEND